MIDSFCYDAEFVDDYPIYGYVKDISHPFHNIEKAYHQQTEKDVKFILDNLYNVDFEISTSQLKTPSLYIAEQIRDHDNIKTLKIFFTYNFVKSKDYKEFLNILSQNKSIETLTMGNYAPKKLVLGLRSLKTIILSDNIYTEYGTSTKNLELYDWISQSSTITSFIDIKLTNPFSTTFDDLKKILDNKHITKIMMNCPMRCPYIKGMSHFPVKKINESKHLLSLTGINTVKRIKINNNNLYQYDTQIQGNKSIMRISDENCTCSKNIIYYGGCGCIHRKNFNLWMMQKKRIKRLFFS